MRHILHTDGAPVALTKKKGNLSIWILVFSIVCSLGTAGLAYKKVWKIEYKYKKMRRSINRLASHVPLLPRSLSGIPFGEELGVVVAVQNVDIRNVLAPYNPSLVPSACGYDLFFRYDEINPNLTALPYSSYIGVVSLDNQFKQGNKEFKKIDLQTEYAEDPRACLVNDRLYLLTNQLCEHPKCRIMNITHLDRNTFDVKYNTPLDLNLSWIEKNWSPFEYISKEGNSHLYLEYRINPRKVFQLTDPQVNDLQNINMPTAKAYLSLFWEKKWGHMSGGTPSINIGPEYLGFFHSWFCDEHQQVWYVIGAYTFNANPPFNLTGISPHPILFQGIYDSPITNTACNDKRVIFPSGIVLEKQNDRNVIHLACGENDCRVKIVTIDKEKLLATMIHIKTKE